MSEITTLDFRMVDFMGQQTQYSDFELVCVSCRITNHIASLGLAYDVDYWFTYSQLNSQGERILKFTFATPEHAMLVKLKGLHNG
jgi:hypothetical protein